MQFSSDYILNAEKELKASRETVAAPSPCKTQSPAESLLMQAMTTIGQRRASYGPPIEHFKRTVGMINALLAHKLREPLSPADWATMMMCDKMSRHQERPLEDNVIDSAGYAACWFECLICE